MLSKNQIKRLRSLKLSKFRQMYNNFVVEGEKMVLELLKDEQIVVEHIVAKQAWIDQHLDQLRRFDSKLLVASDKEMDQISALKTATPVLVVAQQISATEDPRIINNQLSLYLDGIQNPGNLGTILRIADWFGISYVFCSPECADLYNPKTLQSTMGAFLRVRVLTKSFSDFRNTYPDLPIYGTLLEGDSIYEANLSHKGLIVVGHEGRGISEEIRQAITHPIAIPAHPDGGAESLNAAVATGIVCAWFRSKL